MIDKMLQESEISNILDRSFFLSMLCRALLDTLYRGLVVKEILDIVRANLEPSHAKSNPLSYISNQCLKIYSELINFIFANNLKNTRLS